MNIAATQYNLNDKSFEIYISGCIKHPCKGCHNPELWDENFGEKFTEEKIEQIKNKIKNFDLLINKICIYGGEPLEKPLNEILWLLKELKITKKEVWLFTRFEFEEVPNEIKRICDYIKCGKYDKTLKTENNIQYGVQLSTSNQKIYKKGIDY